MRFYDFAVGQSIIDNEVAEDDDSDPVVDPDATPLEVSEGFVTSEYQLAFKDAALSQLTASTLGGKFSGGWVANRGKDATFCNFVYGDSIMTCEAQIDGEYDGQTPIIKAICLEFAQVEDDIYVKATEVKWKANSTLGEALTPVYNPGTLATTESANGYGFYKLSLVRSEEPGRQERTWRIGVRAQRQHDKRIGPDRYRQRHYAWRDSGDPGRAFQGICLGEIFNTRGGTCK